MARANRSAIICIARTAISRYRDPVPNLFSFNSPLGACETCRGFGRVIDIDLDLVIPDPGKSLSDGAIKPWLNPDAAHPPIARFLRAQKNSDEKALGRADRQAKAARHRWRRRITKASAAGFAVSNGEQLPHARACAAGALPGLSRVPRVPGQPAQSRRAELSDRRQRHRPSERHERRRGAWAFFNDLKPAGALDQDRSLILDEIRRRLGYLVGVGLEYLTLDRQSRTLSGGELERVDLTTAIGSSLVNTLYVLDEPSIGLHPRDSRRLVEILHRLRANQNTVVVVEHDPEIIKECDYVIDLGPKAGEQGGQIMFAGTYQSLLQGEDSLTAGLSEPAQDHSVAGARPQTAGCSARSRSREPAPTISRTSTSRFRWACSSASPACPARVNRALVDEVLYRNLKKLKESPARERHRLREDRRRRQNLRSRARRSVAGGHHAALESGDLHESFRRHPAAVCRRRTVAPARLYAFDVLVQRRRGPLRNLPRRGLRKSRDAVSLRRLHLLSPSATAAAFEKKFWRSLTAARIFARFSISPLPRRWSFSKTRRSTKRA